MCKLRKSLYELKQAPRCWNSVLDEFLCSLGFQPSGADPCVYVREQDQVKVIIAVYVDDLIIACDCKKALVELKKALSERFYMKDLGDLHYCLGVTVKNSGNKLCLNQGQYVEKMLKKLGCKMRTVCQLLLR